jgi:hypothetical protein
MEPLKIHEKKSGGWWVTKTKEESTEASPRSPVKQKSMSDLLSFRSGTVKKEQPPGPVRSNTTMSSCVPTRSNSVMKKLPPTPSRSNTTNPTISINIKSPATKAAEDKTIDTSKLPHSTRLTALLITD